MLLRNRHYLRTTCLTLIQRIGLKSLGSVVSCSIHFWTEASRRTGGFHRVINLMIGLVSWNYNIAGILNKDGVESPINQHMPTECSGNSFHTQHKTHTHSVLWSRPPLEALAPEIRWPIAPKFHFIVEIPMSEGNPPHVTASRKRLNEGKGLPIKLLIQGHHERQGITHLYSQHQGPVYTRGVASRSWVGTSQMIDKGTPLHSTFPSYQTRLVEVSECVKKKKGFPYHIKKWCFITSQRSVWIFCLHIHLYW